jgi:hypothetical protein
MIDDNELAESVYLRAQAISLLNETDRYTPESIRDAVVSGDFTLLQPFA